MVIGRLAPGPHLGCFFKLLLGYRRISAQSAINDYYVGWEEGVSLGVCMPHDRSSSDICGQLMRHM